MIDKFFDNPTTTFLIVATVITISILLLRWPLKSCVLLWKSTLISYILFVIFICVIALWKHSSIRFYDIVFNILGPLLLVPAMLIYALLPGTIKMCPSNFDEFAVYTIGFLFYAIVIWGIMKFIKQRKGTKAAKKKQDDNLEKQTPSTDLKGN